MAKIYKHINENWLLEREEGWQEGDEQTFITKSLENSDYAEIMRQVDAGELTIEPADTEGE